MTLFKLLYREDVTRVSEELEANKGLFGELPIRTAFEGSPHREVEDIIVRGPVSSPESTLRDLHNEIRCTEYTPLREVSSLVDHLMNYVEGRELGRVIVTKLPPKGSITPHCDEGDAAEYYDRFHIVISGYPGSIFKCGNEQVEMLTGEVWEFDNNTEHSVINASSHDRVHIVCDIART